MARASIPIIVLCAVGCSKTQRASTPSPQPAPSVPAVNAATSESAAPASSTEPEPKLDDPSYAFLDPRTSPTLQYVWQAKLVRRGDVFASATASRPMNASPDRDEIHYQGLVVDRGGERVEILCTSEGHRVALWFPRTDVATVAQHGVIAVPKLEGEGPNPNAPDAWKIPGIHLDGGAVVEAEGAGGQPVRVRVKTAHGTGTGFVPPASVGVTFKAAKMPWGGPRDLDASIVGEAPILDAPNGAAIATLTPANEGDTALYVTKLAPPRAGHVLVRHRVGDVSFVGWVNAASLAPLPKAAAIEGVTASPSGRKASPGRFVMIERGTIFEDLATAHPLGVATDRGKMMCVDRCDTDTPTIALAACAGTVHVRASQRRLP